jgi:hypothetical protein
VAAGAEPAADDDAADDAVDAAVDGADAVLDVPAALDDDDAAGCLLDEQATSVLSRAAVATDVDASRRLVVVLVISGLPGSDGAQMVMKRGQISGAAGDPASLSAAAIRAGDLLRNGRAVVVARRILGYGLALIRRSQTRMPPAARLPQVT